MYSYAKTTQIAYSKYFKIVWKPSAWKIKSRGQEKKYVESINLQYPFFLPPRGRRIRTPCSVPKRRNRSKFIVVTPMYYFLSVYTQIHIKHCICADTFVCREGKKKLEKKQNTKTSQYIGVHLVYFIIGDFPGDLITSTYTRIYAN